MTRIILLLFLVSNIYAQVEYSGSNSKNQFLPRFFIDLASYESEDSGKSRIDVFIKVPYSNVQFLKSGNEYITKYTLTISLYDYEDELLILEKLWNEKITTQIFNQTSSHTSFNVSYKSFNIAPGEYKFVCKLEDVESRKHAVYEQKIIIREYKDDIELSDIVFVSRYVETERGKKIVPNVANLVTSKDSSLSFFYEIYSKEPRVVKVAYSINNKEGQPLFVINKDITLEKGKNEINETLNNIAFTVSDYRLEVKLLDDQLQMFKGSGKKFYSKIFGFPASVRDLDLAVKQMQFIASPSEINEIEEAEDYFEKLKKYIAYWKRVDPSPNTVENETLNEYYRRVEYANKFFKGYFKGWRSDMGMVYITLGAPDQVTRRPYQLDAKPYEIWEYYIVNRSFIFIDQTNFGDYRLQNPAYGNWFRYRP